MNISKDTEEVLKFLDYVSANSLRKRNDLAEILEIGAATGKHSSINNLILFGTSLWTIHNTVNKNKVNSAPDALIKEMKKSADALIDDLKKLVINYPEASTIRFEEIYFMDTDGNFKNLIDLAHDLHILKKLQTDLKKIEVI